MTPISPPNVVVNLPRLVPVLVNNNIFWNLKMNIHIATKFNAPWNKPLWIK